MAELMVELKKKPNVVAWVLLALGLIALAIFLVRTCESKETVSGVQSSAPETRDAVASTGDAPEVNSIVDGWGNVKHDAPALEYAEFKGNDRVNVKGTSDYVIYDLGEDILFDQDKSTLHPAAGAQLKTIAASIQQHFGNGPIRLYGFTDAQGSAAFNKELATSRAEAVRDWLVKKENIAPERITIEAVGEDAPKATNQTAEGRKENRRVQILVRQTNSKN